MMLHEKYRPRAFGDVVGQGRAVRCLAGVKASNDGDWGGLALWISGQSGTGKTTIARIVAHEQADAINVIEMDAGKLTCAMLSELCRMTRFGGLGARGGWAIIINEAHGLRQDVIRALDVALEDIPGHCVWIFTTTKLGQASLFEKDEDPAPLLSRCIGVSLTNQGLCGAFAERARQIAVAEHMDGQPIAAYERLAKDCRNNLREMLGRIAGGVMMQE